MKNKTSKPQKTKALNKHDVGSSAAKLLTQLSKAHQKLEELEGEMESLIKPLIEVQDIKVFYQHGDGFVLGDDDMGNAPLRDCLAVIINKGKLTRKDYEDLMI